MNTQAVSVRGLTNSVLASMMFGLLPVYVQFTELTGNTLFWNRIIFSVLCLALACYKMDRLQSFKAIFLCRKTMLMLSLGGLIVGFQWWLFVWAPVNDKTEDLSLGYFLLPLTLALVGKLFFNEKLNKAQYLAIALAFFGVLIMLWQEGSLPWVSLAVAGLYPVYFIIRKPLKVDTLPALLFEHLLFLPASVFILMNDQSFVQNLTHSSSLWYLLPGLGLLCSLSLICYLNASRHLSVSLFGLLSYLEPALIFIVAITILDASFSTQQWFSYLFIWLATAIICADSAKKLAQPTAT
ncbi:EamA family transporter RarD [Endozoicomonas arenosclerae]|uniref:EamA family transporter RarD n=1 Tax=Endozoicomonas arenosclerae TaxID=1633495 RepID=UPI0007842F53|nr:EamA family transporter RarD [Endozoicomonas arenosclerae]